MEKRSSPPRTPDQPAEHLIPEYPDVRSRLGNISRTSIWRLRQTDPTFPKPVQIGGRKLYASHRLDAWIERQVESTQDD